MVARVVSAEESSIHETSIVSLAAITMFYLAIAVAPSMADHRWDVLDWHWPEYIYLRPHSLPPESIEKA